jgi:hypothetical protein
LPRYDVRQAVRLRHLPTGSAGDGSEDTYWKHVKIEPDRPAGPSVGGPWYLGILRGGNADLGTDVMKDILAPEHEVWSSFSGSGGPVSRRYYEGDGDLGSDSRQLPYMEMIQRACKEGEGTVFPFDRNQVVNYLNVSPILYDLIRRAMDTQFLKETDLSHYEKNAPPANRIFELVRSALARISEAQSPAKAETK